MTQIPKRGDRIRLLAMDNDPEPVQDGLTGTVESIARHGRGKDTWFQIDVSWDNGRTLMLTVPPDQIAIIADHN